METKFTIYIALRQTAQERYMTSARTVTDMRDWFRLRFCEPELGRTSATEEREYRN